MSRRWRYPRSRRGSFQQVPPPTTIPTAADLPPAWREQAGPRPRFAARIRRGVIYLAPAQAAPPAAAPRRRTLAITVRRGRFWVFAPAPVIVAPPRPADSIGHDRLRLGGLRRGRFTAIPQPAPQPGSFARARQRWLPSVRRGQFMQLPAPLVPIAPAFVPQFTPRHRPNLYAARRGRYLPAPLTVVAPTPPPWVPPILAARRPQSQSRVLRRGRHTSTPLAAQQPGSLQRTRPRWLSVVRRGRFFSAPPTSAAPAAPAFVPQLIQRHRLNAVAIRRGRFLVPPFAIVAPVAPAYVPQSVARRRTPAGVVHGRFFAVPLPVVAPTPPVWMPSITSTRRPWNRPIRRGRFIGCPAGNQRPPERYSRLPYSPQARHGHRFDPPWTPTPPPAGTWPPHRIGVHRRTLTSPRRGRFTSPPPQVVPPQAPATVPTIVRTRRRLVRPRRGCFLQWPVFQATQPVVTDLPDLTATETVTGRTSATETAVARLTTAEAVTGRVTSSEVSTGRVSATETVTDRIETVE